VTMPDKHVARSNANVRQRGSAKSPAHWLLIALVQRIAAGAALFCVAAALATLWR